ncbi:FadR/GntR family transcriptional regulator [Novosphingobium sp.]|uniref:FadR/GntR family transcriptional regulator n=1 Tax=Novosphingobium sp. TaxID=1874826 RepID=UPI00262A3A98|nr:FadR/GntR family transcriptional regulator [Novosphingobium sp.]
MVRKASSITPIRPRPTLPEQAAGPDAASTRDRRGGRLYEQVAASIAQAIGRGEYPVGGRLPAERELASSFSVSRPTIREAVMALELDGLVDVRVGSGVYVRDASVAKSARVPADIGAFELTEARLLFEGEVAALAATQITDDGITELRRLLEDMERENASGHDAEAVDEMFHLAIARATNNSAMIGVVQQLWETRRSSPQCALVFEKSRAAGCKPVVAEHLAIVEALAARDPAGARAAMRAHLGRVLDYLLDATALDVIEEAQRQIDQQRVRFGEARLMV